MKIIVVEDEIRIRQGVCNLIKKINSAYEVVGEADNGKDGLDLIVKYEPDLVITDIKMPVIGGLEMLSEIQQRNIKVKVIVLSAYSDFSYAQKAIRLGVSEYLIKPITVVDLMQSLKNIEDQFDLERKSDPKTIRSLENIVAGILYGSLRVDEDLEDYLKHTFNIDKNKELIEICVYLGNRYKTDLKKARKLLEGILEEKQEISYCMVEVPKERSFFILVYKYEGIEKLKQWITDRGRRLQKTETDMMLRLGWICVTGLENINAGFNVLLKNMDWHIAFHNEVMISYPDVLQLRTDICSYPIEIENKLKNSLCAYDMDKVKTLINQFSQYFISDKLYSPKEIKESYIRFMWVIINVAKEVGAIDYKHLEQQSMLEAIAEAKSLAELSEVLENLYSKIIPSSKDVEPTMSLTVNRVMHLIHEFYQTGITLEEIAVKLNLTPEYLGTQFHKETGVNYSLYIRNYRIGKAKELLIGTSLKLYEIAEIVGYGDAKYFSRVFRECTGQLPADYRKAYK